MRSVASGRAAWRIFLLQLAALAGVAIFLKFYLPHAARVEAAQRAAERERKIESFFRAAVVEETVREVEVRAGGEAVKRHPQKLRGAPQVTDVEAVLGAPDTSSTDFRGGQHLTWIGTAHQLQASFNQGRLYCLTQEDRATGHGALVYESLDAWHPY